MTRSRSWMLRSLALMTLVGALAIPNSAQAWWRGGWGGVGIGFVVPPVYVAPPVYYPPPPVDHAPPPVAYAPPPAVYAQAPARWGTSCDAGAYLCPLAVATPAGTPCSCPANQGRAWGHSR